MEPIESPTQPGPKMTKVRVQVFGYAYFEVEESDTMEFIKTKTLNQLTPSDLKFTIEIEKNDKN